MLYDGFLKELPNSAVPTGSRYGFQMPHQRVTQLDSEPDIYFWLWYCHWLFHVFLC